VVKKNLKEFFNISTFNFDCLDSAITYTDDKIILAPNPNGGNFFIYNNLSEDIFGEMEIINTVGKTVYKNNDVSMIKGEKVYFDFSTLPNNVYILIFKNKEFKESKKIIICK
jgi:hypothetical protein